MKATRPFLMGHRIIRIALHAALALLSSISSSQAFQPLFTASVIPSQSLPRTPIYLSNRNSPDNNNQAAGSVAAGAILGGLVGGPFGLLFGARIGANLGRNFQNQQAKKTELERLGITPEMLQMAEECGLALERAIEGLNASQESLDSLKSLARRLETHYNELYVSAQDKIVNGDEDGARKLLLDRKSVEEKLKKTLKNCAEENSRLQKMQTNMNAIEERGLEIEVLLKRSVGAKALMDTNDMTMGSLRLEEEDPLLRKFRDLENS